MARKKKVIVKPDYTDQDLRSLTLHLDSLKETLQNEEKHDLLEKFETLTKFLKATYFSAMLFEDWVECNGEFAEVLLYNREDLPLLVNGDDEARDILLQWRLSYGK